MWMGVLASARGYKEEIAAYRRTIAPALVVSIVGALGGALLLLRTPPGVFRSLIPWLLLFATVVFAISPFVTKPPRGDGAVHRPWQLAMQFAVALYGGYFGAGMGILMLAILSFSGLPTMNAMNGIKNLLAITINGVALVPFVIAGIVAWPIALLMAVFSMIGGYFGARFFRRLPSQLTRIVVLCVGAGMTAYFFIAGF